MLVEIGLTGSSRPKKKLEFGFFGLIDPCD